MKLIIDSMIKNNMIPKIFVIKHVEAHINLIGYPYIKINARSWAIIINDSMPIIFRWVSLGFLRLDLAMASPKW